MLFIVFDDCNLGITPPFVVKSLHAAIKKVEHECIFLPPVELGVNHRRFKFLVERPFALRDDFDYGEHLLLGYTEYPEDILDWDENDVIEWTFQEEVEAKCNVEIAFYIIELTDSNEEDEDGWDED